MEYYPTKHAVSVMAERSITWDEVLWVLANPEVSYRSDTGKYTGRDTLIKQRGTLYVVIANVPTFNFHDKDKQVPMQAVITTGLRKTLVWNNTDAVNRARDTLVKEED